MTRHPIAWCLAISCCALALAAPLGKRERAQLMAEAQAALRAALTAQGLKKRALRAGDPSALADQEQIEDESFRKIPPLLEKLGEANDKKTWRFICKVADRVPARYGCHQAVLAAATKMSDPAVQADIKKSALKLKSPALRRVLVLHLANRKEWDVLVRALKDRDEQVAALAAWRLIDNRVEEAVEPMIDRLERLEGDRSGIWDVLRNGLGRLLGKRCNFAAEYRSLWQIVQDQGGLASVESAPKKEERPAGALSSSVRLFGREIDCTRVVFILDVSGSMEQVDPDQRLYDDDGGSRVRRAGDTGGGRQSQLKTRLERAQRQLKKVIRRLPAGYKINIVAYSSRTKLWRAGEGDEPPQLHALTKANRDAACAFVDGFRADGVTATDAALRRAFSVDGARCFYLLSDGFATADGKTKIPTEDILAVIDEYGKDRRVTIHTLGFRGADVEMMKAVAEHTGGEYSDID